MPRISASAFMVSLLLLAPGAAQAHAEARYAVKLTGSVDEHYTLKRTEDLSNQYCNETQSETASGDMSARFAKPHPTSGASSLVHNLGGTVLGFDARLKHGRAGYQATGTDTRMPLTNPPFNCDPVPATHESGSCSLTANSRRRGGVDLIAQTVKGGRFEVFVSGEGSLFAEPGKDACEAEVATRDQSEDDGFLRGVGIRTKLTGARLKHLKRGHHVTVSGTSSETDKRQDGDLTVTVDAKYKLTVTRKH